MGCEGRCRCHEVDIGVTRMAKVPRKLEFATEASPQRPLRAAAKKRQARDKCEIFEQRFDLDFRIWFMKCRAENSE